MKERPILFSGPMVRALLEGRKTQTRRVMNPQPNWIRPCVGIDGIAHGYCGSGPVNGIPCPYGQPGDRLWVQETFAFKKGADVRESFIGTRSEFTLGAPPHFAYRATEPTWGEFTEGDMKGKRCFKWKPSIFMRHAASRITLEITDVRVQRLQKISGDDSVDEGIDLSTCRGIGSDAASIAAYRDLWDSINAKRPGCAWKDNPWIWALTFKLVK